MQMGAGGGIVIRWHQIVARAEEFANNIAVGILEKLLVMRSEYTECAYGTGCE